MHVIIKFLISEFRMQINDDIVLYISNMFSIIFVNIYIYIYIYIYKM